MKMTRRHFVKAGAAAASAIPILSSVSDAASTVNVGGLHDLSGNMTFFGTNKFRCFQLAIEETNASGGLLGKKVNMIDYDTQSNNQVYAQFARRLALRDRVTVVHGGLTSSSREVVRPILRQAKTLYFYNMPYEGGVCDRNIFCTGSTPGQLLENLLPYCIKEFGPKIYVLGADYNFGHISAAWTKALAPKHGGKVIAADFFPLNVNQFGAAISKIQKAKPDVIINTFVGPAHAAFYGQWFAAGMKSKIPIASQTFVEAAEHMRMPKEVSEGIVFCYNYVDEIPSANNQAFLKRFKKRFGEKYGYLGDLAATSYQGWVLYAAAVKKAGSFDRDKVIKALETGMSIEGPSGKVTVDPATHHCVFNMYLGKIRGGKVEIMKTFENVRPTNPGGKCDLIKRPNTNTQYEPKL